MSAPSDDGPDVRTLRSLTAEAHRLGAARKTPANRLRLLLLKKELMDLVRQLREGRTEVGRQRARQLAVTGAATAYARIRALGKPGNRRR